MRVILHPETALSFEYIEMNNEELIQYAYAAFDARETGKILQVMHTDVEWARAWESDYAQGYDEVKAYWKRQ
jgi:ketosteroid isomerase-like protein